MNDQMNQAIQKRAYELWQQSGSQHGRDQEFWITAEKEIISQQQPIANSLFENEKTPVSMNSSENKPIKKQSKKTSKKAKTIDAGLE